MKGFIISVSVIAALMISFVLFTFIDSPGPRPDPTPLPPLATAIIWSTVKTPDYIDFFRYAESYKERPVRFEGKVIQVLNGCYHVAVEETDYGWDVDSTVVACGSSVTRIIDGDIVEILGYGDGTSKYKTVLGARVERPVVDAEEINLLGR